MPTVKFIKTDGSEHTLNVENGSSLMEVGRDNNWGLKGPVGAVCPVQPAMFTFPMQIMPALVRRLMMKWICLNWHLD